MDSASLLATLPPEKDVLPSYSATMSLPFAHRYILGVRVDAVTYESATAQIIEWARERGSRYVCVASVHGIIEASQDDTFKGVLNGADINTPDGMPLVFGLRRLGEGTASRVYGPDLTLQVCRKAAENNVSIALFGGTEKSLETFVAFLRSSFPKLRIAAAISPPFRPLTDEEDAAYVQEINGSGAGIVLVGIGCPKQEKWMAAHREHIRGVMIGVGAAFDFHSGRVPQAPNWMQRAGLEWSFRLASEPKRLWRRYARVVPLFLGLFGVQLARERLLAPVVRRA